MNNNYIEDEELEMKMNALSLEEWQKELVRKGEYEPEDFEEEDISDDDNYYHEDEDDFGYFEDEDEDE